LFWIIRRWVNLMLYYIILNKIKLVITHMRMRRVTIQEPTDTFETGWLLAQHGYAGDVAALVGTKALEGFKSYCSYKETLSRAIELAYIPRRPTVEDLQL
jgi:hypothetical protein